MITFNVKKVWFDKIKNGEKTHEYREVKDYWTDRFVKEFYCCHKKSIYFERNKEKMLNSLRYEAKGYLNPLICFMNGMETEEKRPRLYAKLKSLRIVNGKNTDLAIDKDVYDIEFELIKDGE